MTDVLIRGEPPGMPRQRKGHGGHSEEAICKPKRRTLRGTKPLSCTSRCQNCEKTNFCGLNHQSVVFCDGDPRTLIQRIWVSEIDMKQSRREERCWTLNEEKYRYQKWKRHDFRISLLFYIVRNIEVKFMLNTIQHVKVYNLSVVVEYIKPCNQHTQSEKKNLDIVQIKLDH